MKTILVTGATSGIGKATAEELAKDHRLIICGRRIERLKSLKAELEKITEVHILSFDVRDKNAIKKAIETLPKEWNNIDILVNNAGNAHGRSTFDMGSLEDFDAMIDINITGLIHLTKAVTPLLKNSKDGHIVNIASIAGKEAYKNGNVYCASKAAIDMLSKTLRIDLAPFGIKVTNIAPGAVDTEFSLVRFKGDKETAEKVYEGYTPLYANDIADAIAYCIRTPKHVQIADMTIFPTAQYQATGIIKK